MDWAMERGLEIAAGLVNYIGNPQRRTELAEDIATALRAAERRGMERAKARVRQDCSACEGTGHADGVHEHECEYCGRPMAAIQSEIDKARALTPTEDREYREAVEKLMKDSG